MVIYTSVDHPWHDRLILQPWVGEEGYLDGLSSPARRFYEKFIAVFHEDWLAPEKVLSQY